MDSRFRLETLLRLRESARDQRRQELAQSLAVEDQLALQMQRVQEEQAALREDARRSAVPGPVEVERLRDSQRFDAVLRSRLEQLARQRDAARGEIEQRRRALVEANRELRTLEILRDRQRHALQDAETRRETRGLDEAGQLAWLRDAAQRDATYDVLDGGL